MLAWAPESFDGQVLELQLKFERPYDISAYDYPNTVKITIKDVNFFLRKLDGWPLNDEVSATVLLPKQIEPDLAASLH